MNNITQQDCDKAFQDYVEALRDVTVHWDRVVELRSVYKSMVCILKPHMAKYLL